MNVCDNKLCVLNKQQTAEHVNPAKMFTGVPGTSGYKVITRHQYVMDNHTFYLCDCCHAAVEMIK